MSKKRSQKTHLHKTKHTATKACFTLAAFYTWLGNRSGL